MQPLHPLRKLYGNVCISPLLLALTNNDSVEHDSFDICVQTGDCYKNSVHILCMFHGVVMKFHKRVYTLLPHKRGTKVLTAKGELCGKSVPICLLYVKNCDLIVVEVKYCVRIVLICFVWRHNCVSGVQRDRLGIPDKWKRYIILEFRQHDIPSLRWQSCTSILWIHFWDMSSYCWYTEILQTLHYVDITWAWHTLLLYASLSLESGHSCFVGDINTLLIYLDSANLTFIWYFTTLTYLDCVGVVIPGLWTFILEVYWVTLDIPQ